MHRCGWCPRTCTSHTHAISAYRRQMQSAHFSVFGFAYVVVFACGQFPFHPPSRCLRIHFTNFPFHTHSIQIVNLSRFAWNMRIILSLLLSLCVGVFFSVFEFPFDILGVDSNMRPARRQARAFGCRQQNIERKIETPVRDDSVRIGQTNGW